MLPKIAYLKLRIVSYMRNEGADESNPIAISPYYSLPLTHH